MLTVLGNAQSGNCSLSGSIVCFKTTWLKAWSLASHSSYFMAAVGCLHLNVISPTSPVSTYTGITSSSTGEVGVGAWKSTSWLGGGGGFNCGVGERQS